MSLIREADYLPSLNKITDKVKALLGADNQIALTFEKCYPDVLRTLHLLPDGTVHVITGDIPAMWLRDSAAQLRPYLVPAKEDKNLSDLIVGVSRRQFMFLNLDPYANAFNLEANSHHYSRDDENMNPWVWERKYEIDSLCYPIQLAYLIWKETGRTDHFDQSFFLGIEKILSTWETEQHHEERSEYRFHRENTRYFDTISRDGKGSLVNSGIGLIWSGFRPSDDGCTYGYLIPSNMFAVVVLSYVREILHALVISSDKQEEYVGSIGMDKQFFVNTDMRAKALIASVSAAIEKYGIADLGDGEFAYAYEVDGFGNFLMMDDANVPSLLSMDYLGYKPANREAAHRTRKWILSEENPYFYAGKEAKGIGSQHTKAGYVWPIALSMQGLTSGSKEEKRKLLSLLSDTTAGTGNMHESFDVNDQTLFSREWFSWSNALFCELVMDYLDIK